jgi:hypothetical protein
MQKYSSISNEYNNRKSSHCIYRNNRQSPFFNSTIQPKLTINQPNDVYEQEADAVADKVMRMPATETSSFFFQSQPLTVTPVQRKCAACEQEEKLRMKEVNGNTAGITAPPVVHDVINSGGQQLDTGTRGFMESRFGYDFSKVQVHNNALAHQSSEDINALAYTHGNHIVFAAGQYQPDTLKGKKLLSHELVHVIQQNGYVSRNKIQRAPVFKDCNEDTAFMPGANKELELTLDRARDFTDVAISVLQWDFTKYKKTSTYHTAVTRHFINPDVKERESIRANLIKMREQLKPANIRCVSSDADVDICYSYEGKLMLAFFRDGAIWLCPNFWMQNRNCRAITLVHEAAHAIGLGVGATHPPYRGDAVYPYGNAEPTAGQSASIRMANPESYAYFAAHIWREIDTQCAALGEVMIIKEKAPEEPAKTK